MLDHNAFVRCQRMGEERRSLHTWPPILVDKAAVTRQAALVGKNSDDFFVRIRKLVDAE